MNRLNTTLTHLRHAGLPGLVCYFTAGDPDADTCLALLQQLGAAGADIIELGIPFSDPVADGPIIQAAHGRALAQGQGVSTTLQLVAQLRQYDNHTPVVLMGYLNPVMQYGAERFMQDAALAGVDGLIMVDLPVEHALIYQQAADRAGIHLIRMTAPTSDNQRLQTVLKEASGFVYHVTLTGTTGSATASASDIASSLKRVRQHTGLPIAVGFGIRSPSQVAELVGVADLVVVGSSLVALLAQEGVQPVLNEVAQLAKVLR